MNQVDKKAQESEYAGSLNFINTLVKKQSSMGHKQITVPKINKNDTQMTDKLKEEFDRWFNHGTKDKPRFAYAHDIYNEVWSWITKNYILREKVKGFRKQHIYVEPIDHPDKKEQLIADGYNMCVDEINHNIEGVLK